MPVNSKFIVTAALGLVLGVSSCQKFTNVNTNPNIAQTATLQTLLPAAQLYVASSVGVDLEINGSFWAEYWTQTPNASQYKSLDQYAPGQDYFSYPWTNLYKAAENFVQLEKLADSLHNKQYKGIAMLMNAYTFQLLTDGWGDVPYKQALMGEDSNILSPKYDSQRTVYRGIIANIDTALKLISTGSGTPPGTDDLVYGGVMTNWKKFGYTLMLKTYLRMSNIDPVGAQAGVVALYATSGVNFIAAGTDAKVAFGFGASGKNPLYAQASSTTLAGIQNIGGSKTCIDTMNADGDYRSYIFYEPLSNLSIAGIAQGDYNTSAASGTYCLPSTYVGGDANNTKSGSAPVNLLTSYESYFLQAEAAARGWSGGNDSALYMQGIYASFSYYSFAYTDQNLLWQDTAGGYVLPSGALLSKPVYMTSDFAYNTYVNGDTTYQTTPAVRVPAYWANYSGSMSLTQKIRFIITQKWFSMCGNQGFEAWCEHRRTGYPDFLVISKNSLIGNTLPKRFLYPTSESTRNVNFPGLQPITAKVWWELF